MNFSTATSRTLKRQSQDWVEGEGGANGPCYHTVSLNLNYNYLETFRTHFVAT